MAAIEVAAVELRRHDDSRHHPVSLMMRADVAIRAGHGELVNEDLA
jgi:hypothetical protein